MKLRPTQPSWPRVLTDWCVIKALSAAGWPARLGGTGEAQAAFVSEVSKLLRFRALEARELEADEIVRNAMDAVYERDGGSAYCEARQILGETIIDHMTMLRSWRRRHSGDRFLEFEPPEWLQIRRQECEIQLKGIIRPLVPAARAAARQAAEAYWTGVAACRLPEGFFADVPVDGAIATMRARFDIWWSRFLQSLREVLRKTNPSYARILEALPRLRVEAARPGQKLVLTALVQQWREANAEKFGLFKDIHFPVLERRSFAKFQEVEAWFDQHARGFRDDEAVTDAAVRALYLGLDRAPPERHQAYRNN